MKLLALMIPAAAALSFGMSFLMPSPGASAAAPSANAAPQSLRTNGAIQVEVRSSDDDYYVTLRADSAPLDQVLTKLTDEMGYDLEGFANARRPVLVTVDLEWRPFEQVLEYVLGSVGMSYTLRAGTVTVIADNSAELTYTEVLQLASVAYLRALTKHPDHSLAPSARMDQGRIAELQGYPGAALEHYQSLLDDYPRAPEVAEAYMRSGYVLQELGRWADAAGQFRSVANMNLADEFAVDSRLELARCEIELGDPQGAIYLLTALDANHAPRSATETGRRSLVRALALTETGQHLDALRVLEGVETLLAGPDRIEGLRVRAKALLGGGNPGDASRAWLLYALEIAEPNRVMALEQAVKLALVAEDEMGALFIVRQAEELGHDLRFAPYKAEAYDRLGFATNADAQPLGMEERITLAETHVEEGDFNSASELLGNYLTGVSALDADLRVRFAVAWAQCVDHAQSIEPALTFLRETRAALSTDAHLKRRARLDIAAASLLEAREMFDQAADAYRGIY